MEALAGDYYAQCQTIFRQATNQQGKMLAEIKQLYRGMSSLSILSVGAGVGLFEMPMLALLMAQGVNLAKFVGNDPDPNACRVLLQKLESQYGEELNYEVHAVQFEDYVSNYQFDLVLFNHVFEYLPDNHLKWLVKAQTLLAEGGNILMFSPNKPGINLIYAETYHDMHGYSPVFAADIGEILAQGGINYINKEIMAECDVSLLKITDDQPDKLMLLSFLAQQDCRNISPETREGYLEYYLSLRFPGKDSIPHPTTLFII